MRMSIYSPPIALGALLAAGLAAACARGTSQETGPAPLETGKARSAQAILEDWPAKPKEVGQLMIGKYGAPDEATPRIFRWHGNGGWKRTILYREEVPHNFPAPHTDLLEQVIDYRVPPDKFDELAAYDGSVIVERTKGEMSARCDKEEMNFLALNLANDIVTGKRSVEEARQFYAQTAMAFKQGRKDPYTQRLQFQVPQSGTADPDTQVPAGP
jgi:hypothetical protein